MTEPIDSLLQAGLNTFEQANEAVFMSNPYYDLLTESYSLFSQVLEHDPNCINAIYYQTQSAGMLSLKARTDKEKLSWLKDCLKSYHRLLAVVSRLNDPTLRSEWLLKSYSDRSEFLQSLERLPHAKQSAIADLSICIQISAHHRFYVRRGRLQLLQGNLLSATEDYRFCRKLFKVTSEPC